MAHKPGASPPRKPSRSSNYLRYSGLGLQLLLTILIAGWLGYELDEYMGNKYPVFMLLFGTVGFFGIMYKLYRNVNRKTD